MNPFSRHQSRRRQVGLAALCLAAGLLALSVYLGSIRRSTQRELAIVESTRDRLQATADRWEAERRQAEKDRRIVLGVLGQCRSAEDIPKLLGDRIVARRQTFEKLCIYVPEGSHTLAISSSWKQTPVLNQPNGADASDTTGSGAMTWRVALQGASGYLLQLVSNRTGGPVQWELTSNHADFQTQVETVPVEGFSHRGSSWSGTDDVVQFPNQVQWSSISELESAAAAPHGVNLMNAMLNGVVDDQPYEISLDVRIFSDTPACIPASDAQRVIILGREDLLKPYSGAGKYSIRTAQMGAPHTPSLTPHLAYTSVAFQR
jgi:hypothetical protein